MVHLAIGAPFAYLSPMTYFDAQPRAALKPLQMDAPDIERWLLARDPQAIGRYNEIGPEEYARSFAVAQTAGTDLIDDIYYAMVDAVSRGGGEADFAAMVTPIMKRKGWLSGDDRAIANRVALIYDTNLRLARGAGRWDRYWATRDALPYLRTFTVRDERVRHPPKSPHSDHRALEGIILPVDHWFWKVYGVGPFGFRCRCGCVQMTRSQLARRKDGITSEDELQWRVQRLGPPVFVSPAQPIRQQLASVVASTNAPTSTGETLMPGLQPVSVDAAVDWGQAVWAAITGETIAADISAILSKLFGL